MHQEAGSRSRTVIDAPAAAELLDVSVARLYDMARRDMIPVVRYGRRLRFVVEHLNDWLDQGGTAQ